MSGKKASDVFVECLENEGVSHIFGVPGEENADLMMSLENSSIEFVLTRHEQGAAFMADVHGRLTGQPGVCLGTLGPGAANLVTGVADANMDRAPLIVITGQGGLDRLHKESHQNMDVVGMFKPITKWAWSITDADNIPEVVRKAFKLAVTEKPGACHIELPEDVATLETSSTPIPLTRVRRPGADDKVADQAFELIRNAKSPVILAGNGAIRKRASRQLRELAERSGIGVACTFMGKGSIGRDSDQCLFTIGLQSRDVVSCAVDAADLVIAVGYDLVEYPPEFWNPNADKKIVHIDFEPAEVDDNYRVQVEMVGDVAHALWALNQRFEKLGERPSYDLGAQQRARAEMIEELSAHAADDTDGLIRPQKVLWDTREVMGPEDIVLSDVGAHKMWIARHYQCDVPNTCLISNGFCSMGFALPGAMAAKRLFPERRVLAICGDGGFLMNVQEMETAVRLGINLVAMVWEDHEYGLIAWKQDNHFGRHTDLKFGNPDWLKLADAFGWYGARVERAADLKGGLEDAFNAGRPALLVLPIDYRENGILSERLGNLSCPI